MSVKIKINLMMSKYKDVRPHKINNEYLIPIPKNQYTQRVNRYTLYISNDGTVVLKPKKETHRINPWKSSFYQNYNFNKDMKKDLNTRPLNFES